MFKTIFKTIWSHLNGNKIYSGDTIISNIPIGGGIVANVPMKVTWSRAKRRFLLDNFYYMDKWAIPLIGRHFKKLITNQ